MITETTAKELLIQAEPDMSFFSKKDTSIFKLAYYFAEIVRTEIINGEFSRLQKDFDTVEQLLKQGNNVVKLAMSNVFMGMLLNTFAGRMRVHFSMKAFSMLPEVLKQEYHRQIKACPG